MKKYRILAFILIFVLSGLLIYSFASPALDNNKKTDKKDDTPTPVVQQQDDLDDAPIIKPVIRVATVTPTVVDTINPTAEVTYNTEAWTNQDVTVTLTFSEKVAELTDWTKVSDTEYTKSYAENIDQTIYFEDLAGNDGSAEIVIANIDKVLPEITTHKLYSDQELATYTSVEEVTAPVWGKEFVVVELTANDLFADLPSSGINDTTFTCKKKEVDHSLEPLVMDETCTKWEDTNNKFKVTENGTYEFTVKDNATNESLVYTVEINTIDHEGPVLTSDYENSEWTNENVVVTLTGDDGEGIGVDTNSYACNLPSEFLGVSEATPCVKISETEFEVSQNGTYEFSVMDLLGNMTTISVTVSNIDKEDPVVNDVTKQPVYVKRFFINVLVQNTLTIEAEDFGASGLADYAYSFDAGLNWQESNSKTFTNKDLAFYLPQVILVRDKAGNVSTIYLESVFTS